MTFKICWWPSEKRVDLKYGLTVCCCQYLLYHFSLLILPFVWFHCLSATLYKKTGKTRICDEVSSSAEQKPKAVMLIQFQKKNIWILLIETACKIVLVYSIDHLCSPNTDQNCKGQVSVHVNTVIKWYDGSIHVYPWPPSPKRCGPTETTEQTAHPQASTLHSTNTHTCTYIYESLRDIKIQLNLGDWRWFINFVILLQSLWFFSWKQYSLIYQKVFYSALNADLWLYYMTKYMTLRHMIMNTVSLSPKISASYLCMCVVMNKKSMWSPSSIRPPVFPVDELPLSGRKKQGIGQKRPGLKEQRLKQSFITKWCKIKEVLISNANIL